MVDPLGSAFRRRSQVELADADLAMERLAKLLDAELAQQIRRGGECVRGAGLGRWEVGGGRREEGGWVGGGEGDGGEGDGGREVGGRGARGAM